MKPVLSRFSLMIFVLSLVSCGNQNTQVSTEVLVDTNNLLASSPTSTFMPITITPSPLPTEADIIMITPNQVQVERWKEYEQALALKLLPPNPLRGEVLCEWEILEQAVQVVYVWAFCQSPPYTANLPPSIASVPVVIYLAPDGSVQEVQKPGSGSAYANDIRKLFPPNVQGMILSHSINTSQMEAHINLRRQNPSPPLVILSAIPDSTTTPESPSTMSP